MPERAEPTTQHRSTLVVAAPPEEVWALLSDPARHVEADSSEMVQGAVTTEPITAVGQVFTMEMVFEDESGEALRYRTDNTVDAYEPMSVIGWRTGEVGKPPAGWYWRYLLRPVDGGAEVTLVYDWEDAPPDTVALVQLPAFSEEDLAGSLADLARAVERRDTEDPAP